MRPLSYSVLLLSALAACSAPGAAEPRADERWTAQATAERTSPASVAPPNLSLDWTGADGRAVKLVVHLPDPARLRKILSIAPGAGDSGPAIRDALASLSADGGGTLRLAPGVYRVGANGIGIGGRNMAAALLLRGLRDIRIEGPGAILLFEQRGTGIRIEQSHRIAITGITLRYAQSSVVIGRVVAVSGGTALEMPQGWPAGPLRVHQLTSYDPATRRFPSAGRRAIFGKDGSILAHGGDDRFTGAALSGFAAGESVSVKLTYYQGAAIQISDPEIPLSDDIVIDHVAIENASGMGIAVERMGRGLAIVHSRIGSLDPRDPVSVPFDGIHVGAAAGDILIRGNMIIGTGDDGINLNSPVFRARSDPAGDAVQINGNNSLVARGDRLAMFDGALQFLGSGIVVDRGRTGPDGFSPVRLDSAVAAPDAVKFTRDLAYLGSRYAVVDNDVGHCECHGLLAQGPNGLIRGNRFTALRYNAIRLLTSGLWREGAGVHNVVVEQNVMTDLGRDTRRGFNWAAIAVYGDLEGPGGEAVATDKPVNSDVSIRNNSVRGAADGCISVASVVRVQIAANLCSGVSLDPASTNRFMSASRPGSMPEQSPASVAAARQGIWADPLSTAGVSITLSQ